MLRVTCRHKIWISFAFWCQWLLFLSLFHSRSYFITSFFLWKLLKTLAHTHAFLFTPQFVWRVRERSFFFDIFFQVFANEGGSHSHDVAADAITMSLFLRKNWINCHDFLINILWMISNCYFHSSQIDFMTIHFLLFFCNIFNICESQKNSFFKISLSPA